MKLTLANIRKIKQETDNSLVKKVCNYVIQEWNSYDDKKCIFTDVIHYGCQSGMVSELVWYNQTTAFYKKYQSEIAELLYTLTSDLCTQDMSYIFGSKWDKEDPLALEDHNQNLLAWFGFEETLRNIGYRFQCLQEII